ncbi:DsbA family protein, partial [Pseudomonas aeruginosa]|uniref:DsbA family protein n=1 Tax=Pseudomonas aeruginosa TaxID=287 RepID=UPI0031B72A8D
LVLAFSASAAQYEDGKQYTTLEKPVAGAPQVLEFFSFFCPHCYQFEEVLHISDNVKKKLPEGVKKNWPSGWAIRGHCCLSLVLLLIRQSLPR